MKISALPLLDPALLEGTEDLPIVKGDKTYRSTPGNVVDATFGPLASALAVALGNYRPTYAQAVTDLAVGQMFACDASGTMCLYRRISDAPGYVYFDDVVTGSMVKGRTVSVDLAVNMGAHKLDASVTAIITGGHAVAGYGQATYVSDALATAALGAACPALCRQTGDGRWWRLAAQHGAISIEQAGAVPNDAARAVANVAAATSALAYLAQLGGGMLSSGAGLFSFDAVTLGNTGLAVPSGVSITGPMGAIWAVSGDQASCMLLTNTGTGTVWIEGNLELRGMVQMNGLTGGGIKAGVSFRGKLSSAVQYSEYSAPGGVSAISIAAAFAANLTYNDGANGAAPAGCTSTVSGSIITVTMNPAASVGNVRYGYNVVSDYIALDPTARYVVQIKDGFLAGAGGNQPIITLYDANKNPIDAGMGAGSYVGAAVNNAYSPAGGQNDSRTAMIYGAAYIRVQVGAYRGYGTSAGLVAMIDVSKMVVYQVTNDLAAHDVMVSPGDSGQVVFSGCANITVDGAHFSMIDRSAAKLTNCTSSTIRNSTTQYVLQGFTDDYGDGNSISDNPCIDLRLKTVGGALINSTAFRLRCIGGGNGQRGSYCRNVGYGASWGIEILAYNNTYRNDISGNRLISEYCGISAHGGDWTINHNTLDIGPAGFCGIEVPGNDTSTRYNLARGVGNIIRWSSFSGYYGVGISATNCQFANFKDCQIKAPYIVQNINNPVGSTFLLTGTSAEFSACALLHRASNSAYLRFTSLIAGSVLSFPYSSIAGSSVFDIQANDTSAVIDLHADHMINGADQVFSESINQTTGIGAGDVRLSFPDMMANPAGYNTNYYFTPMWLTSAAKKITFDRIRLRNVPAASGLNNWAKTNGTPYNGSYCYQQDISVNGNRAAPPDGLSPLSFGRGNPFVVSYLIGVTIGTLAAGASYTMTGQTMKGLPASGSSGASISTFTPGGDKGLLITFTPTADNTFTITFTNVSGASLTPPAGQSWRVQMLSYPQ